MVKEQFGAIWSRALDEGDQANSQERWTGAEMDEEGQISEGWTGRVLMYCACRRVVWVSCWVGQFHCERERREGEGTFLHA